MSIEVPKQCVFRLNCEYLLNEPHESVGLSAYLASLQERAPEWLNFFGNFRKREEVVNKIADCYRHNEETCPNDPETMENMMAIYELMMQQRFSTS